VRAGAGVRVHRPGSGWYRPPTRELCWLCIADAVVAYASGPVIKKYLGVLAAAERRRPMTSRCATWTPLHHGRTIRLQRCDAMMTVQDSAPGQTGVVTACAGAIETTVTKALQEAGHCTARCTAARRSPRSISQGVAWCSDRGNHRDPVTTNHLPGGKAECAAKTRTARLRRLT
jgi:hypothetical protein